MIKKVELNIWDRVFALDVIYDCYSDEVVTKDQEKALIDFINNKNVLEKSKKMVQKYCKKYVDADYENQNKDNVFSYIKPDYIYIKRENNPKVIIMCKYKYDIEHGIAIVFEKDDKITVCVQDLIL